MASALTYEIPSASQLNPRDRSFDVEAVQHTTSEEIEIPRYRDRVLGDPPQLHNTRTFRIMGVVCTAFCAVELAIACDIALRTSDGGAMWSVFLGLFSGTFVAIN